MTMVTITVDTRDMVAALAALDLMGEQLGSQVAFGNQIYVDLGERTEESADLLPVEIQDSLADASDKVDQVRNRLLGALQEGLEERPLVPTAESAVDLAIEALRHFGDGHPTLALAIAESRLREARILLGK